MSFAEKGAVSDIEPAFFIGYLHRVKATGTLKFEDAPLQRAVYFREGRILFCSSNAPDDQLGAILIAAGKISQEQFDAIVAGLEPKQSIAAALAQGGHVSQRDIGDAARRKVEQIIGSCCAQTTGSYDFEDGVLPKGALDLKLTTEKVLIAAFEVLEPSGFLNRILRSPMAVLTSGETEPVEAELVRLKSALDGVSSLADIGGAVGLPLAATEARAAVLVILGAASVVTSQIEEMALPEINENAEIAPSFGVDDSEPVEAQTMAFMQAPTESETIGFGSMAADAGSAVGSGLGSSDSTLVMSPGENAFAGGSDATLVLGQGLEIPSETDSGLPSDSGIVRNSSVPKRDKASTQDLDAVKELIGAPAPSRPGVASLPSERWEPVLSADGRPGRKRNGAGGVLQNPAVQKAALVLLVVAVGVISWLLYAARQSPPPVPSAPSTTPDPAVAVVAPTVDGTPTSLPSPPPGASAAPSASTPALSASASPVSAAVVSPSPKAAATVAPTATPAPKPTEKPTPSPTPRATTTPTPQPAPVRATPATAALAPGQAYEFMKTGRLAEAGAAFETAAKARANEFSIQILVACSPQTVTKAIQNDPSPDLFVLPATMSGKACHRMMRGYFKTQAEAAQAVSGLPGYYVAEGAKPRAVPLKTALR